jgi:hypothetical protein
MIAICPPAEAQWNGMPATPARTGSLRRIDEIVNELMAGYSLPADDSRTEDLGAEDASPRRAGRPCAAVNSSARGNLLLESHGVPVEMMSGSPR